jgi:hypothetical protein
MIDASLATWRIGWVAGSRLKKHLGAGEIDYFFAGTHAESSSRLDLRE